MSPLWFFIQSRLASRRIGAAFALCLGLAGTTIYGLAVDPVYPVQDWLIWVMAKLWLWLLLFTLSCISVGQVVLERLMGRNKQPALESVTLSMVIGTVCFAMALYVGGALAIYNASFAVALPVVMLCVSARNGFALLRRLWIENAQARTSWFVWAVTGFGIAFLALVYLGAMTPDAISVDASMVHMKIAQDYARTGRIVPFATNYHTCVPQLASLLYTWAFIVPGLQVTQHWMLALHLEFCLFVFTLVGVSAAIQRMVGDYGLRAGWVSVFLFPGFFAADSNLSGSADHVVAFFSVGIAVATLHVCKSFTRGSCILLGISLAGALLTKYQAAYLVVPTSLLVAVTWLYRWYLVLRAERGKPVLKYHRDLLWAPAVVALTTAVLVSPHFIKNAIFYNNPVYPFMEKIFVNSNPQYRDASFYVANLYQDHSWVPPGTLTDKFEHALDLFLKFSFKPHYFLKDYPYYGSLFTLLLPGILFVQKKRKTARVAFIGAGALLLWGMVFNVDRNLQTFMPVLACVTGALIVKLWKLGWLARTGLVPLVAFQVIWGADLPLFDSRGDRIRNAMDLIASGIEGHAKKRFDDYRRSYVQLGEAVPQDSRLLLHLGYDSIGINREVWLDRPGFQGLITGQGIHNPRELFDYYHSLKITHLVLDAREDHAAAEQDEILIRILLRRYANSMGGYGAYHLFAMPNAPPPAEHPYQVLALGVSGYAAGLYPIDSMGTIEYLGGNLKKYNPPKQAASPTNAAILINEADVVLMRKDTAMGVPFNNALLAQFESVNNWKDDLNLYLRRRD